MLATSGVVPVQGTVLRKVMNDIRSVYSKSDPTFLLCLPRLADAFFPGI